jgi:acyl-CoA thioesterase FadM
MLALTHTSSVTEDQIDHLGHMNVRFYGTNAHAATNAVLAGLDGWPDGPHLVHDAYTRHHREQLLGTSLLVRSGMLAADADGLRIHHELVPHNAEALAATFVHRVSPLDERGERVRVPDAAVEAARVSIVEPLPYAAPRSVDLDRDALATAPPLELLRERRLDVRLPRTITAEECDERGRHRSEATMMLLWAGEAPDHVEGWGPGLHEGPDGELMGWALMETRVQLARLPRIGTRIQSFGATIALHERATHRMHWCYDLDRRDLLCSFEAVDVAFDTRARRSMVIPESIRRRQESVLHADLAPQAAQAD